MKLIEATDDQKTVRLGIVKLGTAVGKVSALGLISKNTLSLRHGWLSCTFRDLNEMSLSNFLDEVRTD